MRVLTVIPTYNEKENLPVVVERLRAAVPDCDILVVDDNSPDGTGQLADSMAAEDSHINVLHRTVKDGLGGAYLAGFDWGLEAGYDVLVEMDADCSHQPEQLPLLLQAIEGGADLAIGSRYVPGGKTKNWPLHRQILSRGANLYTRLILGTKVKDITAGYRAYRREALQKLNLEGIDSKGYVFQVDLAWRSEQAGLRIVEVPITFVEREIGSSKMDGNIIVDSMTKVTRWGLSARAERVRSLIKK
ncbi:polyprenol monophosphomannose synthase [Rothia nasimurium]|uniref:Polyprenol monophosphomannose synthase n=1 Tax=Rothia nasimurium TaxID=85336 RepID=A0A4Y9F4N9_9MICC|nr:polyprenol monophosphomannose synthase [Rothia nasimurium]MBF0807864.1 polyprenol monophosphomannose synthase [Rothia nasimurium]TFU23064.1 polyprenol monophosphomannose synthase [Rothia nasimurium]